jgi:general secretion pathway protein G
VLSAEDCVLSERGRIEVSTSEVKTQDSQFSGRTSPRASRLAPGEQGFTIVELMIVVTIAGILVMLAEPSFTGAATRAREAALKQNLFTMRDVIDQFKADRGKYPAALLELKEVGYLRWIPVDPFTKSDSTWQEILDEADGGVFDVHSGSDLVSPLDGTPYNQW